MDERESIGRLKRGDISGLEMLVRRYQVQAIRAAYLVTRDRPLAEDVVQTAFLRAYERIDQFDARRPFGPWFLRSVINDAAKVATRQGRQVSLDHQVEHEATLAERLDDPGPGPEAFLEHAEAHQVVQDALDRLSPSLRAAVVLRYVLELSEAEMADQLACPRGTIKRRLHEARKRLRTALSALLPDRRDRTTSPCTKMANLELEAAPQPHRGGK